MPIIGAPATNQPVAPRAASRTPLTPSSVPGVGAGGALFAKPNVASQNPKAPNSVLYNGPPTTPSTQAAQAINAPTAAAIQAQQQDILTQQALAGQQMAQAGTYARNQYNTGLQGLGLDQQNINLQLQGLGSDRNYMGGVRNTTIGDYNSDIKYDKSQRAQAISLYNALMKGYNTQRGPSGTIAQQLQEALGKIAAQRGQAQGQFTNDSQQLGEQVGAQGAFGSRGAIERQGFLQSTLGNTLAGLTSDQQAAHTQQEQQNAQLGQQIAQALNQRQGAVSLANRRQQNATIGIKRANLDYKHGIQGNTISAKELDVQAARLGVSRQQYADALQNAIASAGLQYNQGLSTSNNQLAQLAPQVQQLFFNQISAANTLGQSGYGSIPFHPGYSVGPNLGP